MSGAREAAFERVTLVRSTLGRLKGLLGTSACDVGGTVVALVPCRAIHTFGMRYPIDVAFFDRCGMIVVAERSVECGRFRTGGRSAYGVLERAASTSEWFSEGQSVCGMDVDVDGVLAGGQHE